MKKFKKMMALAIAMVMVLSMSISVFAANHEISTTNTKHTYEIYQIFTGTVDNGKLTSLKYGQNTKGRTIGDPVSQGDVETLNGIADAGNTAALDQADIAAIIPFVDITGNPIAEVGKDKEASASVPEGYYLIKDKDNSLSDPEQYTLYLIQVLDADLAITPKSGTTTSDKKIKDINDSTDTAVGDVQDSADYDIGDDVPYVLTANLAANVSAYKKYHITFKDELEAGKLKNNKDYVVKIKYSDNTEATLTKGTDYTVANETDDGFNLTLEWGTGTAVIGSDAKLDGAKVTVEFTAKLLEGATIGQVGNINTSKLEYSNNPNDADGGVVGETPEDTVIVFTYKLIVDKTDDAGEPLTGATFSLYKKYKTAPTGGTACTETGYTDYYKVDTIAGTALSKFEFKGIDDGDYVLIEDVAPKNYNKLAPQAFTVTATHTATADINKDTHKDTSGIYVLTSISGSAADGAVITLAEHTTGEGDAAVKDGVDTTVINKSGAVLPETGGIGTTIFYIIGAILVIGAGVVLVTRRRMSAN